MGTQSKLRILAKSASIVTILNLLDVLKLVIDALDNEPLLVTLHQAARN